MAKELDIKSSNEEWFDTWVDQAPRQPEVRLMWAILHRAIADIVNIQAAWITPLERMSAWEFIEREDYSPLSFLWICEHIGVDAQGIRAQLDKVVPARASIKEVRESLTGNQMTRYLNFQLEFGFEDGLQRAVELERIGRLKYQTALERLVAKCKLAH